MGGVAEKKRKKEKIIGERGSEISPGSEPRLSFAQKGERNHLPSELAK